MRSGAVRVAQNDKARSTIADIAKLYDHQAAKNTSSTYGYGASTTKDLTKSPTASSSSSGVSFRNETASSSPVKSSPYPSLSSQSFDSGAGSPYASHSPSAARESWQSPKSSSNFGSIHNELASLNLFGAPPSKFSCFC